MIVADTSALVTLATADVADLVLEEFDVHTTKLVIEELRETADHDDSHGRAADDVLSRIDSLVVHDVEGAAFRSSRIDGGEASCVALARQRDADFFLTDDLRALPELETLTEATVAISPFVLRALVKRDVLSSAVARDRLDQLAEARDWLGAPIYRRALRLFEDE